MIPMLKLKVRACYIVLYEIINKVGLRLTLEEWERGSGAAGLLACSRLAWVPPFAGQRYGAATILTGDDGGCFKFDVSFSTN